jgi:uncharacterized OsmC-like protein
MGKFITTYLGELRCENLHEQSGTKILTDAPTDNQGKGSAFSPTDLCALSLTTCIITTMGIYAQLKEFSIDAISADTYKIMQSNPRRISKIKIDLRIDLGASGTERNKEGLQRIVNSCPVSKSLHPDIEQEVLVEFV